MKNHCDNSIEWSLFTDDIENESFNINSNDIKNIEVVDYEVVVGDSYVSDEFEIEKDNNEDLLFTHVALRMGQINELAKKTNSTEEPSCR